MNQSSIPPLFYRALAVIGVIIMASGYSWQGSEYRPGNEWCYADRRADRRRKGPLRMQVSVAVGAAGVARPSSPLAGAEFAP